MVFHHRLDRLSALSFVGSALRHYSRRGVGLATRIERTWPVKRWLMIVAALTTVLVALKLSGTFAWPWLAVLLPAIAGAVVLIVALAIMIGVAVGFGAASVGDRS